MHTSTAILVILACVGVSAAATCQQAAIKNTDILAVYTPGQNQIVPVSRPFTITWDNTTGINSVSIVLGQGPATNLQDLACIVNNAPNTGNYIWIPSPNLVPDGNHNYGLKIISDVDGQFQYSTQFGISNPNLHSSGGSTSGTVTATSSHINATATHTKSQYAVSSGSYKHSKIHSSVLVIPSSGLPSKSKNGTHPSTTHHSKTKTNASTGGYFNSTKYITPTKSMSKPSSLPPVTSVQILSASTSPVVVPTVSTRTTGTTSAPATAKTTGAAVRIVAGGVLAGLGAVAAFAL